MKLTHLFLIISIFATLAYATNTNVNIVSFERWIALELPDVDFLVTPVKEAIAKGLNIDVAGLAFFKSMGYVLILGMLVVVDRLGYVVV